MCAVVCWGHQLRAALQSRNLGSWWMNKLSVSQHCTVMAKKTSSILGCISRNVVSRSMVVILPFYSALVRKHAKLCFLFWFPWFKRDMDMLERIQ